MYIPGVSSLPQKKDSNKIHRRVNNLLVGINKKKGVYVKDLTGTSYVGYQQDTTYTTKTGKPAKAITTDEYCKVATEAVKNLSYKRTRNQQVPKYTLVHDRATVHRNKKVNKVMEELNVRVVLAPPRSPDLMPLDYAIFGRARLDLDKNEVRGETWDGRCARFREILRRSRVAAAIDAYPERLKACIRASGGHIEKELRKRKREQDPPARLPGAGGSNTSKPRTR